MHLILPHGKHQFPLLRLPPHQSAAKALTREVEEFDAVHAAVQRGVRQIQLHRLAAPYAQRVEIANLFPAHHRQSEQPLLRHKGRLRRTRNEQIHAFAVGLRFKHVAPLGFGGRQIILLLTYTHFPTLRVGGKGEDAHSFVKRRGGSHDLPVGIGKQQRIPCNTTAPVGHLKRHALRRTGNAVAALGEERNDVFADPLPPQLRAQGAPLGVGAVFNWQNIHLPRRAIIFPEHGNNARKAGLCTPVHHFAGIGTQFVVAGTYGQFERNVALCPAETIEAQKTALSYAPAIVQQFHIEHLAHRIRA